MLSPATRRALCSYVEISKFFRSYIARTKLPDTRHPLQPSSAHLRPSLTPHCHPRHFHQAGILYQEKPDEHIKVVLENFKESLVYSRATDLIHELVPDFVKRVEKDQSSGERKVVLHGYLGTRASLSRNLIFVPLLDFEESSRIQIISSPHESRPGSDDVHEKLKSLRPHTPVVVSGWLQRQPSKDKENIKKPLGDSANLEVLLYDVQSLNEFPPDVIMKPDTDFPPEQRHLQLRTNDTLIKALKIREKMQNICRNELRNITGFLEVETPLLFKSTSEGAREYIVPTRRKGLAYALPQSPQQFKQILMASGIGKYFQFAKCFRDEDLRADRQPEFTQLDLEMSFADGSDVREIIEERIIRQLWSDILGIEYLPRPFPQMTYKEAMTMYGSDKPDLRNPIQIHPRDKSLISAELINMITSLVDPVIELIIVRLEASPDETRRFVNAFLDSADARQFLDNPDGGPGVFIYDSSKPVQGLSAFGFEASEEIERRFELEDGHLIILQARKPGLSGGSSALGNMRTAIHDAAVNRGFLPAYSWKEFKPLWIVDFPLFSPSDDSEPGQGGNAGFASTHHPFTSPKAAQDVDLLLTNPELAEGDHYDLVINGEEIGGGSRRIHHSKMQEFIFRDILKMDEERITEFSPLLEALRAGCPPHAGIALGFDRLVAMMCSSKLEKRMSMRDVIAFPKSAKGDDLMVKSPSGMSEEQLETHHLELRK